MNQLFADVTGDRDQQYVHREINKIMEFHEEQQQITHTIQTYTKKRTFRRKMKRQKAQEKHGFGIFCQ